MQQGGETLDRQWLWDKQVMKWVELERQGMGIMIGDFGLSIFFKEESEFIQFLYKKFCIVPNWILETKLGVFVLESVISMGVSCDDLTELSPAEVLSIFFSQHLK